jgi:FlaA1/EpsC-like NDP-sugar epimerase
VNILSLAKTMALFAGRTPDKDVSIEFTGLAEGEKITEELWEAWEHPAPTGSDRILVISQPNPLSQGILRHVSAMEEFVKRGEEGLLLAYLRNVVPGFKPKHPFASNIPPLPPTAATSALRGAA